MRIASCVREYRQCSTRVHRGTGDPIPSIVTKTAVAWQLQPRQGRRSALLCDAEVARSRLRRRVSRRDLARRVLYEREVPLPRHANPVTETRRSCDRSGCRGAGPYRSDAPQRPRLLLDRLAARSRQPPHGLPTCQTIASRDLQHAAILRRFRRRRSAPACGTCAGVRAARQISVDVAESGRSARDVSQARSRADMAITRPLVRPSSCETIRRRTRIPCHGHDRQHRRAPRSTATVVAPVLMCNLRSWSQCSCFLQTNERFSSTGSTRVRRRSSSWLPSSSRGR